MTLTDIRQRIVVYILLLLPGLAIFSPVLFRRAIFTDGDAVLQLYPALSFFREALLSNQSFLWNPYVMTGFPTAAGLMGGFFSAFNQLIYQLFSVPSAYAWLTFVSFFLAGVFTFELVKKMGRDKWTAVFAAVVFPWITANFIWSGNKTVTSGLFLLPFLLWLTLSMIRGRSWKKNLLYSLFGGLVTGMTLIPYHFQWSFQILLVVGVWVLALAWRHRNAWTLIWPAVSAVIAALIAWPQFRLLFSLLPLSGREGGVNFQEVLSGAVIPGDFFSLLFPDLSVGGVIIHPGFFYIGAPALLMLIFSWFGRKDFYYKFFMATLLVSLLLSVKFSPLTWLAHQVPGLSSFREFSRFMYLGLFAVVIMSADGFEAFFRDELKLPRLTSMLWKIATTGFILFLAGSVFFGLYEESIKNVAFSYFDANYQDPDLLLPREHYYLVIERMIAQIKSGLTFPNLPVTVSAFSFLIAAGLLRYRNRFSVKKLSAGFIILALFNLGLINIYRLGDRTASASILTNQPPVVEFLKKQERGGDFRTFTAFSGISTFKLLDTPYGYEAEENIDFMRSILTPNLNLLYGIDSLDYYDNLMDRRHGRLLAYLGSDRAQAGDRLIDREIAFERKISLFLDRLPVLGAYNTRFIISAFPFEHEKLTLVYETRSTRYNIPVYVYKNTDSVRPRYYLTSDVMFTDLTDEEKLWEQNLIAIQKGQNLIECERCQSVFSGEGDVRLVRRTNSDYVFEVETDKPRYFIFGQNNLPGWRAEIDSQPVEIHPANYVNQAVFIPSGKHVVAFRYQP